jgi:hypothetical protein
VWPGQSNLTDCIFATNDRLWEGSVSVLFVSLKMRILRGGQEFVEPMEGTSNDLDSWMCVTFILWPFLTETIFFETTEAFVALAPCLLKSR